MRKKGKKQDMRNEGGKEYIRERGGEKGKAGKDETGASHRPALRFLLPFPSLFLFLCFSSLSRSNKKRQYVTSPIRESIIKYGKLGQFLNLKIIILTRREQEIPHLYRWRDELR